MCTKKNQRINKTWLPLISLLVFCFSGAYATEPTRWRGPEGNGIYPDRGLMKEWPEEGPELLWSFSEMGEGHSSPVFSDGYICIPTMIDQMGHMFKLAMDGTLYISRGCTLMAYDISGSMGSDLTGKPHGHYR